MSSPLPPLYRFALLFFCPVYMDMFISALSPVSRRFRTTVELLALSSVAARKLSIEDCAHQIFAFTDVVVASYKMENFLHLKYTRVFEVEEDAWVTLSDLQKYNAFTFTNILRNGCKIPKLTFSKNYSA